MENDKKLVHISNYTILITSIVYFIFRYFFTVEGDWGEEMHPVTPYLQKLHILLVPLLVFTIGMFYRDHVHKRIVTGMLRLRTSGIILIISFVLMVFTGYLIQVLNDQTLRRGVVFSHLIISGLWSFAYLYHHIRSRQ